MAGRASDDHAIKYVISLPLSSRLGLFWVVLLFRSSLVPGTDSIFVYIAFLCVCGAVFYNADAFNGNLSVWDVGSVTNMKFSTYTLPSALKIGVF